MTHESRTTSFLSLFSLAGARIGLVAAVLACLASAGRPAPATAQPVDEPDAVAEPDDVHAAEEPADDAEDGDEAPGDEDDAESEGEETTRREKELLEAFVAGRFRLELYEHVRLFHGWYRDELVYAATGDAEAVFNRDELSRLKTAAGDPAAKIGAVDLAWRYLDRNIARKRVLRDLFFTLAG